MSASALRAGEAVLAAAERWPLPGRPRARLRTAARTLAAIAALAADDIGLRAEDLAERLHVSRSTMYRDLEMLLGIGVPLEQRQDGEHVRWRLAP